MRTEEGLAQVEQALEIADRRGNDGLARNAIALRSLHVLSFGRLGDGFRGLEKAWEAADRAEHLMPAFSRQLDRRRPAGRRSGTPARPWPGAAGSSPPRGSPGAIEPLRTLESELARACALAGELTEARQLRTRRAGRR